MESGRDNDGAAANGAAKETPSTVVDTFKPDEETRVPENSQRDNTMSKHCDEDVDEGAQERMLKDESTAKVIAPTEKNAAEVGIFIS